MVSLLCAVSTFFSLETLAISIHKSEFQISMGSKFIAAEVKVLKWSSDNYFLQACVTLRKDDSGDNVEIE